MLLCVALVAPGMAQGRKHPSPGGRHNISIAVSDNPIVAGDQLAIFGHLGGPNNAGRVVTLWRRHAARFSTPVQQTRTDAHGFYAFLRAKGVVDTNRSWYVTSLGARSRTIHERVFSLVTVSGPADGSNLQTGRLHKVTFTGTVSPFRAGDPVILQRQASQNGNGWHRIDASRVRSDGTFTIVHTFRVPGSADIRVRVQRTRRNVASLSNVLSYEISQAENPALTLNASDDPIVVGHSVTLSGRLKDGAGRQIIMFAKTAGQKLAPVDSTTANSSGDYSFVKTPLHNTIYVVKGGGRTSAQLFEGVRFLLTASETPSTVSSGQRVTFSGTVSPDAIGHVIYLQRRNRKGTGFHTVGVAMVGQGGVYSITRRLFVPGTKVLRVFIPGGGLNESAASQAFTIIVNSASPQQVNGSRPNSASRRQ